MVFGRIQEVREQGREGVTHLSVRRQAPASSPGRGAEGRPCGADLIRLALRAIHLPQRGRLLGYGSDGGHSPTTVRAPHAEDRETGNADHAGTFFPDSPSWSFCRGDDTSQAACGASSLGGEPRGTTVWVLFAGR